MCIEFSKCFAGSGRFVLLVDLRDHRKVCFKVILLLTYPCAVNLKLENSWNYLDSAYKVYMCKLSNTKINLSPKRLPLQND